jgi:hypothetical protein
VRKTCKRTQSQHQPHSLQNCRNRGITHVDLDDLVNTGPGSVQNGLDVIAAGLCLFADVALDEVAGSISGNLAGDEELAVGTDSLGLSRLAKGQLLRLGFMGIGRIGIGMRILVWGFVFGVGWKDLRRGRQLE